MSRSAKHDTFNDGPASKSRLKRERQAINDLGVELIEQSDKILEKIGIAEPLLESIRHTRGLSKGARKRELKYLGAQLANEDLTTLRQRLEEAQKPERDVVARFHATEKWRDELLEQGTSALDKFLLEYPQADRQLFTQLLRNAAKEKGHGKAPRSARNLFRAIADILNVVD